MQRKANELWDTILHNFMKKVWKPWWSWGSNKILIIRVKVQMSQLAKDDNMMNSIRSYVSKMSPRFPPSYIHHTRAWNGKKPSSFLLQRQLLSIINLVKITRKNLALSVKVPSGEKHQCESRSKEVIICLTLSTVLGKLGGGNWKSKRGWKVTGAWEGAALVPGS